MSLEELGIITDEARNFNAHTVVIVDTPENRQKLVVWLFGITESWAFNALMSLSHFDPASLVQLIQMAQENVLGSELSPAERVKLVRKLLYDEQISERLGSNTCSDLATRMIKQWPSDWYTLSISQDFTVSGHSFLRA